MNRKKIKTGKHNHLLKFTDENGGCVMSSGNISTRLVDVPKDDEFADGCMVVPITDEDIAKDDVYRSLRDNAKDAFEKDAPVSVVIPVHRLRAVLDAVDAKLIRLDVLPSMFEPDVAQASIVDGNKYIATKRTTTTVSGLRVFEITDPAKANEKIKQGDSAVLVGCMTLIPDDFVDEPRVARETKRKEIADALKTKAEAAAKKPKTKPKPKARAKKRSGGNAKRRE